MFGIAVQGPQPASKPPFLESDARDPALPHDVPSLYALEVWRAMTGRVPSADELQHAAAHTSQATLAWPAPANPTEAISGHV